MNDNEQAGAPRVAPINHEARILLWGVGALLTADLLSFAVPGPPASDAVRIDLLPTLIVGTMAAFLSRQGIPAIVPAVLLAFGSLIQAPFVLFTQEHCGAAVSNMTIALLISPLLFASPMHVIPTLGTSFALAQWVLRRVYLIAAGLISIGFICLSAAAWWVVVLNMPGTGSCPNF